MTTNSTTLVADLKKLLKVVTADLTARSDDPDLPWAQDLRRAYDQARERGRTGLTWSAWRTDEIDQAAVAWVLGSVFVRFCEDNGLIDGTWIAGDGERARHAADAETEFYRQDPSRNSRDWLRACFATLADLPASAGVLDRAHSPVWAAPLGADACNAILSFWRAQNSDGTLQRPLADPTLDTRFLGDLYQDLSDLAKKKYALLQTPVFVEEFILDQTLEPALAEFGLKGLRLIDPTCGSGHFLLGAFQRLLDRWDTTAPGMDRRERVQAALNHIHGVDLNPFAVAIARFRLTIAALQACGLTRLKEAPAFDFHVAVGDSLLGGSDRQRVFLDDAGQVDEGGGLVDHTYPAEDLLEHPGILQSGRYHVVVGNPPYITVKDKALNQAYRDAYPMCSGKYALSVPFMELFFRLAVKGSAGSPAGYVGQITSNSFMKREFGRKVIETLLAGRDVANPVDLTTVIDTSGAYIPGHGTPTVILIGRRRTPDREASVRGVLGVRGEPGQPSDSSKGLVWTEIVGHLGQSGYDGDFVSVADLEREVLDTHPWSLSGGGAAPLFQWLESNRSTTLAALGVDIGMTAYTGEDSVYLCPARIASGVDAPIVVEGDQVRDFTCRASQRLLMPTRWDGSRRDLSQPEAKYVWHYRAGLRTRLFFGRTHEQRGMRWFDLNIYFAERHRTPLSIVFAFVSTHNHFVLDRGGKVFKQSAPVIKLPAGASEDEHLALLGVLNSSTACFWLKQVCHDKGNGGIGGGIADQEWERFFEFTGTKLQDFPLPAVLPLDWGLRLDALAQRLIASSPQAVCTEEAPTRQRLDEALADCDSVRQAMFAAQEELDWEVYGLYGLTDAPLTYTGSNLPGVALGERAFEIVLARRLAAGEEQTAWFERHGSTPITEMPPDWPQEYQDVVQRRIDLIESDKSIRLLERPEFKRRWASRTWADMEREAVTAYCLDRLEAQSLWRDAQGPRAVSIAGLAQATRQDEPLMSGLRLLAGTQDIDVTHELTALLREEGVPFLAALRYTDSGLVKRAEWEQVWDLQRREDAGETVDIPVPPKYGDKDFRSKAYWRARGKLDVPKERFIAYPGAGRGADTTEVLGWAGWDHAEQAQALARLILERQTHEGWGRDELVPLLAGLAELEPWLHQWHADIDPAFGQSPAAAITALLDQQLNQHQLTRADLVAWDPPANVRGRRRS